MKSFLPILIFFFLNLTNNEYRNTEWMIEIDLSGTNFLIDTFNGTDTLLNSEFSKFILPKMHCKVEKIDFQPEIRIFDKYLHKDSLDYRQISSTLYEYLDNKSEILSSMMCPDEYGQLFGFIIQKEHRYFYYYHLINVDNKYLLIEYVSTFGTKRDIDKEMEKFIKRIKTINK
jgi:hypothetical protein